VEGAKLAATAKLVSLSAHDTQATNSIDHPEQVVPVESVIKGVSGHVHHTMPGLSIQVIAFEEQ
jgi:alpha-L-arabinofuranosidase